MSVGARPGHFSEPVPFEVPDLLEIFRLHLPLLEPFVAAHGVEEVRDLLLVRAVAEDGSDGWGECSTLSRPGYTPECTALAWEVLRDDLAPKLLASRRLPPAPADPMAATSLEVACSDLALRRLGRPLSAEFGGSVSRAPVGVVVGIQPSLEALLDVVDRRVTEGYAQVKLKVAPNWFLEPLEVVRAAWPDLPLAADANGSLVGWADGPADDEVARFERLRLDYLEQPMPADDLGSHGRLVRTLDTPLALDESISGWRTFEEAIEQSGAPFVVNVKPARLGGIDATRALLHRIEIAGCSAFVGGMLESGVGRATALAVATSPVCNRVGDLGPSDRYYAEDVVTRAFTMNDGTLAVPADPGLGVEVDRDAVDRFTVDHVVVRRA